MAAAMSNAERQRRYRQRVKARLQSIEAGQAITSEQEDALVEVGRLLTELAEAWLKVSEIFPDVDVSKISSLAADMQKTVAAHTQSVPSFTPRELAVLSYLKDGTPNRVIAAELGISDGTVKVFVRRIMMKMRAKNRTQAALAVRDYLRAEEKTHDPDEAP
jgi:DNA-binding NarL/FixJ family response regulator